MRKLGAFRYVSYVAAAITLYLIFNILTMSSNYSQFNLNNVNHSLRFDGKSSQIRATSFYKDELDKHDSQNSNENRITNAEANIINTTQIVIKEDSINSSLSPIKNDFKTQIWNETQKSRQKLLHKACQFTKYPTINNLISSKDRLSNIIIDDIHRTLYCYIPKVACTQWKRIILVLTNQSTVDDPAQITHLTAHYSPGLKFLSNKELKEEEILEKLNNYMKFIIVRHPLERLLSAYRDKFNSYSTDAQAFKKIHAHYMMEFTRNNTNIPISGEGMKFEEFLTYLSAHKSENFQEHWMPYFHLCHPCTINYDFIGKHETLQEDSDKILEQMRPRTSLKFPPFRASKTTNFLFKYVAETPKAIIHKIYEIFNIDFQLFGYQTV